MADSTAVQKSKLDAERRALKARVSDFRGQIASDGEALLDEARRINSPESALGSHPKATVATSAAIGFVAGLAPAKVPKPHLSTPAPVSKVAGKGASAGLGALKVEAGIVVRDLIDGMFKGGKENASGQGSRS